MAAVGRFPENYHAYLLRLTRAGANRPWEVVAQDVETGEEYPIADPDALIAVLKKRVPTFERREQLRREPSQSADSVSRT